MSEDLRKELKHTLKVFFSEFGKLTPVQEKTIPIALSGKNAMIMSPTASGKTEAIVAPICENILRKATGDLSVEGLIVLYIIPTRALVSDISKRLENKLERLSISCATKTSDRNNFKIDKPQNFLFTTPESTDSLLSRHPEVFKNIDYIVIDELHFLDNNFRGDQLRVILKRILDISKNSNDIKFYAMSATVKNPETVAKRYFDSFEIIITEGSREIEFESIDIGDNYQHLAKIKDIFIKKNIKKSIFFCNKRTQTVLMAKKLKEIFGRDDRIFEHHSSISSAHRKFVEKEMGRTDGMLSICAATASLEVGIDIGNIEGIVLVEPPLTISSLLQRIGRGNRRTNKTVCFGLYRHNDDKKIFDEMIEDAKKGNIEDVPYEPEISVCVQQILSLVFEKKNQQNGILTREKIHHMLSILESDKNKINAIIDKLVDDDWIEINLGKITPTSKLLDFDSKVGTSGKINSNISGSGMLKVVDQNGNPIGEITEPEERLTKIQLASHKWEIIGRDSKKITVRITSGVTSLPRFTPSSKKGYFYSWLPK